MKIPGLAQELHRQFETRYGPSKHWSPELREALNCMAKEAIRRLEDQLQRITETYGIAGARVRLLGVELRIDEEKC